mmetsp:Transcript_122438/g.351843  ORF Transcript_122438/g.351843 Transcript_122438/m.351843 type:complete len:263 (+) Transcript_122438:261-1049(+)
MRSNTNLMATNVSPPFSAALCNLSIELQTCFTSLYRSGARSCSSRLLQMLFRSDGNRSLGSSSEMPADSNCLARACKASDFALTSCNTSRICFRRTGSPEIIHSATIRWQSSRRRKHVRTTAKPRRSTDSMLLTIAYASFKRASRTMGFKWVYNATSVIQSSNPPASASTLGGDATDLARVPAAWLRSANRFVTQRHSSPITRAMAQATRGSVYPSAILMLFNRPLTSNTATSESSPADTTVRTVSNALQSPSTCSRKSAST